MELVLFIGLIFVLCFVIAAIVPTAMFVRDILARRRAGESYRYEYRFSRELVDAEYPTSMGMMSSNTAIEEAFRESLESDGSEYRI